MKFIIYEILKGNLIIFILYFTSFIFRKVPFLNFFWFFLRQKQSHKMAFGASLVAATFYFIVNIMVLFRDLRYYPTDPDGYSFFRWLIIILPLTVLFKKLHFWLTPKVTNKDEHDLSH
ncbi:hypothetical protein ACX8XN_08555 [Calditrichota bacterium GD2]